jgi:anti-sigma regulatory factor (Ser/Thr protein kinase)
VWVASEKSIETLQSPAGPPLGWFEDCCPTSLTVPLPEGPVYLWTDGIEELARDLDASPLSVAHALLRSEGGQVAPEWISAANDDLLVTRLFPSDTPRSNSTQELEPLVVDFYRREQIGEIDALQRYWENSLRIALPDLDETTLYGVLLPAREAVANALLHGCLPGEAAAFQICYCASTGSLSVLVSDPGPGHSFPLEDHDIVNRNELVDAHRGLMLIESFATQTERSRNGANLRMEFSLI